MNFKHTAGDIVVEILKPPSAVALKLQDVICNVFWLNVKFLPLSKLLAIHLQYSKKW